MNHSLNVTTQPHGITRVEMLERREEARVVTLRIEARPDGDRVTITAPEHPAGETFLTGASLTLEAATARAIARVLAHGELAETVSFEEWPEPVMLIPDFEGVALSGDQFREILCSYAPQDIARIAKAIDIALMGAGRTAR